MVNVAALYRFTKFGSPEALKGPLARVACRNGVRGTLLLAPEGINGTIAGSEAGVALVLEHIRGLPGCSDIEVKHSTAATMPFGRMKVRLKREIVAMGQPDIDPLRAVGRYVEPRDWTALISRPDVVTIDTRNAYEVEIGSFSGAIDPESEAFRDFPAWWNGNRHRFEGKRVAMFCTGGIRCEKATSYLVSQGVEEVFHLRGGILKYLEDIPEAESAWKGQCFVFDERVSVGHGLMPGGLDLCRGCRRPLTAAARNRPGFEEGVSCHRCLQVTTEAQKNRFRERHRQVEAARRAGGLHVGR